jgi:hypothetical protein
MNSLKDTLSKGDERAVRLALDLATHGIFNDQRAEARAWCVKHADAVTKYAATSDDARRFVELRYSEMGTNEPGMLVAALERRADELVKSGKAPKGMAWNWAADHDAEFRSIAKRLHEVSR